MQMADLTNVSCNQMLNDIFCERTFEFVLDVDILSDNRLVSVKKIVDT